MKWISFLYLVFVLYACTDLDEKRTASETRERDTTFQVNKETSNPYEPVDVSPMDMSYFPVDYPKLKMANAITTQPVARVIYSRPHRQGRKIFGNLLAYGSPWRLGANEATELDLYQPVTIQNKRIAQGRYVLYCIPNEKTWSIVFNSNIDSWGLKPDPTKDLYRFEIPVQHSDTTAEFFTMVFEKTTGGADLLMAWDDVVARLPIKI
jgi:hypothetical protein